MRNYEKPKNAKGLCRYLGMINFYPRFMQNSAKILMPLYDLLAEHNKLPTNALINRTQEQEHAFNKSKNDLVQAALLAYPAPNEEIFLAADASDIVVAAVLYQKIHSQLIEPVGFFSKRLDRAQIKWTIFSRELPAIYLGAKHFSYFLQGTNFTIQTDHQAIVSAAASSRPSDIPRKVHHLHYLTTMSPNWQYITGSNDVTIDSLPPCHR